jgi:hypothetical protein
MSEETGKLTPEQEAGVEKIRKILSKVNHEGGATVASEAEMNTAMEMARKLMSKFDIDEGLFERLVKGDDESKNNLFDQMVEVRAYHRKEVRNYEFFDYMADAVTFVCDVGFRRDYEELERKQKKTNKWGECPDKEYQYSFKFYGLPRDVAMATALYQELVATMFAMSWLTQGKGGWTKKHNSYAMGIGHRLYWKGKAIKDAAAAATSSGEEAQAGAIVISKRGLLDRYKYDVLGYTRPPSEAERAALNLKWEQEAAARKLEHEKKMLEDPAYRKEYEREQKRQARLKGPRPRTYDRAAYNKGYEDAENISLGTNQIGRKAKELE